jgi:phage-related protein
VHLVENRDRPLVWLHGEVKSPPFSTEARRNTGFLLRLIQRGNLLSMPLSRPMPAIGSRCHELRIADSQKRVTWRLIYRLDEDAVVIGDVFVKKTQKTPQVVIEACRRRFKAYDKRSE